MRKKVTGMMSCPCGSGKRYKDCCKKKRFQYYIEDGKVIKQVPVHEKIMPLIQRVRAEFERYYGRVPDENEFVLAFAPVYNDEMLLQTVYTMRRQGIDEAKIYAYYKSGGLMPCKENLDILTEADIEEFNAWCKEYNEAMVYQEGDCVTSVNYVMTANRIIEENVDSVITMLINCLNDCIHRHREREAILKYQMSTEQDYCLFSALKTIRTLQSVHKLKEDHLAECIYSLGHGIFENYMYLCSINRDIHFFEDKLLPKVDESNYSFAVRRDGSINYNRVIRQNTGEVRDIKVNIGDLVQNLPYDLDKELYNGFYKTACQYVHVDVMSAKAYFSCTDPYNEIDGALIACLMIAVLATMLLLQLVKNSGIQQQYRRDVEYLCKNVLGEKLIDCLETANGDPEHQNDILTVLSERLMAEKGAL